MLPGAAFAALTVACAEPRSATDGERGIGVLASVTGAQHAIEVTGLGRAAARRLDGLAPNDTGWPALVAVYVDGSGPGASRSDTTRTPPIIGRYGVVEGRLRFEPRFPFTAGVAYRVEVDTTALAERSGSARVGADVAPRLTHRFSLPVTVRQRTTRVVGVHPSASRLPTNLLRWYVQLSAPMEPGNALAHVRLLDESGREVTGAFLALDQELWDPERRRLTLLLDPGRVKRGVRTNVESGPPLIAGRRYRLVIDDGWIDGTGAPLASGFEHAFDVVEADRRSPDPRRWGVTAPRAHTREALRVAFGESLDHALAGHMLAVRDPIGREVAGVVQLAADDSVWSFAPVDAWTPGDYTLSANSALEDVAGNSIARLFDVDRRGGGVAAETAAASGSHREVRFRIVSP